MAGSKSDYRRAMSPVTLAPKTHNPWTNPMKRGIVSPAYDAAATTIYKYGPSANMAPNLAPSYYLYSGDPTGQDTPNVADARFGGLNRWNVTPGAKVITAWSGVGAFLRTTHTASYSVDVWKEVGSTGYELVATSGALTPVAGSTGMEVTTIDLTALGKTIAVTIEAGVVYYVGLVCVRTATGTAFSPWLGRSNGYTFANTNLWFSAISSHWNGTTISRTNVEDELYSARVAECLLQHITYTSTNYLEMEVETIIAAKSYLIPGTAAASVIKFETCVVEDTDAMTIVVEDLSVQGVQAITDTIHLDSGDTSAGTNTLTFGGELVELPDINPGGGVESQDGEPIDLLMGIRATTLKSDLYWQNRGLECVVHGHHAASSAARGAQYDAPASGARRIVTFSGDVYCPRLLVGTRPMILIGDSQVVDGNGTSPRSPNANRWGGLPTSLAKERIWLMHGEGGLTFGPVTGTEGIDGVIFNNATPGSGDGIELLGLGCDWLFGGMAVNDVAFNDPASDADARDLVGKLVDDFLVVFRAIVNAGETPIIAGLPPYSKNATTQYDAKAIRWYNRALLGLAQAWKCVFYNPWPDMVEPGTEGDEIPTFLAAYTVDDGGGDDGLHYSVEAGTLIRARMVSAIENSTIDLRDAWD